MQPKDKAGGAEDNISPASSSITSVDNLGVERERLILEREKFEFEKETEDKKLKAEESKTFWMAVATAVPLVATFVALVIGVVTAWVSLRTHREQAKLQFDLKTAEIIFSGVSYEAIHNRARALKKFFGDQLSDEFAKEFKPEEFNPRKESPEAKKLFCSLMLQYPKEEDRIVELWFKLFPADFEWLGRIDPSILKKVPSKVKSTRAGDKQVTADLKEE